jgi:REP element-mobilizing transposase RayT
MGCPLPYLYPMPVKQTIPYNSGIFFITFTCHQWLPLIDKTNGYDIVYNWFDHLKSKGHFINGFVIMPNHVHVLISFINAKQSINTIVGNGKRFMAYEMIERLKTANETLLLELLANHVEAGRKQNNKQHEVWELSFDWKDCRSNAFIYQKLDYMHNNPFVKKWALCSNALEYLHSSAKFYLTGEQGFYPVTNFMEMEDMAFNENK